MREFLLRTPSEIESLFCKLGSYLAHESIRFNHFISAFPFMGSFEEAVAQDHAMCPLIVERCPVGIQIWPTNQQSLQKFVFQLLCQNVGSSPPPPQSKICILMPFLYLVCARWICSGLHISTGVFLGLRCLCMSRPHRARLMAPSFMWRPPRIRVQRPIVFCV